MTYEDIYSRFFSKCSDSSLLKLSKEDAYSILKEYLQNTMSEVYIRKLFSTVNLDDIDETITYSLVTSVDAQSDENFIVDVLASGMVVQWMKKQVDNNINLALVIGGKEEKVLKNNYAANVDRVNNLEIKLKKKIRDYGYEHGDYDAK